MPLSHLNEIILSQLFVTGNFIDNLLQNLSNRFPEEAQKNSKALDGVLNPKRLPQGHEEIGSHGHDSLHHLLDFYVPQGQDVDPQHTLEGKICRQRCMQEFLSFKHFMSLHKAKEFLEFLEFLLISHSEDYPDFAVFAEIALVVPLNSASCERGFSCQNKIKTKTRNRLGEGQLERMMKITINGPHFAQFDYTDAKANFRALKDRRM